MVFSLLQRVLDATYQVAVEPEHLQAYLDEFVFRFNRRPAKQRGLLFLGLLKHTVAAPPVTYRQIAVEDGSGTLPSSRWPDHAVDRQASPALTRVAPGEQPDSRHLVSTMDR